MMAFDFMGKLLRGDTTAETKATLKVVKARLKRVLIYSKIQNATLCLLPWTQVAHFISKGTIFAATYQLGRLPTIVFTLNQLPLY